MIWNVVEDCNDYNDKPTCWACEINSPIYGKYLWITKIVMVMILNIILMMNLLLLLLPYIYVMHLIKLKV